MITIRLGKWFDYFGKKYRYKRIYIKGYKWTPFVRKTKRNYRPFNYEVHNRTLNSDGELKGELKVEIYNE